MDDFRIERTRGDLVESVHRISLAVVRADGTEVAAAGRPDLVTFWRSAAKPFQALPLVEDGVLEAFGLGSEELAIACASHSSEAEHLAVVERFLARIGCSEDDLACGPHPPLGEAVARQVTAHGTRLTPRWSNCSGKHAGMLALARHHGWPTAGYERREHPVQQRMTAVVSEWAGIGADDLRYGVDGCTTVCFGLSLRAMARAYARFAAAEGAAAAVRDAMMAHPRLVAGTGRLCSVMMEALPGQVVTKIGAEGIYCLAVPASGVGLALKVEDGDMRMAPMALVGALDALGPAIGLPARPAALDPWRDSPITDTRGHPVGTLRAGGHPRVSAAA